jgi:hypothetical protein
MPLMFWRDWFGAKLGQNSGALKDRKTAKSESL